MDPSPHILKLHDDHLHLICKRLHRRSDCKAFELTCHRWLRIQISSCRALHFKCPFTPRRPICVCNSHPCRMIIRYEHLQCLTLSGCTDLLDSCLTITDLGLVSVAKGCGFLTDLNLHGCNITVLGLESLSELCSGLKHLNLSCCFRIFENGVGAVMKKCRKLHSIDVSHCRNVNGTGFEGCLEDLVSVVAASCKFGREGIRAVLSGGGVEYLDVSKLSWSSCHKFNTDTRFNSKLTLLNFRRYRNVGNDVVVEIARGCALLREWNLSQCHDVTLVGWEAIGSEYCTLEQLHVNRCRNLCDAGLLAVRDGCKRLRMLYLGRSCRVSSTAVEMFKREFKNADWPF